MSEQSAQPLRYLLHLLSVSSDHYARTDIVRGYDWLLSISLSDNTKELKTRTAKFTWRSYLRIYALDWTARGIELFPIDFAAVWREVEGFQESVTGPMNEIVPFLGLRPEDHTAAILEFLYDGPYKDFIQQLVDEQPRYQDLPSDVDVQIARRTDDNDFPALTDLLAPVLHDVDIAIIIVAMLNHHIAYTCNLFSKTD